MEALEGRSLLACSSRLHQTAFSYHPRPPAQKWYHSQSELSPPRSNSNQENAPQAIPQANPQAIPQANPHVRRFSLLTFSLPWSSPYLCQVNKKTRQRTLLKTEKWANKIHRCLKGRSLELVWAYSLGSSLNHEPALHRYQLYRLIQTWFFLFERWSWLKPTFFLNHLVQTIFSGIFSVVHRNDW